TNGYRLLSLVAIVDLYETLNRYMGSTSIDIRFIGLGERPVLPLNLSQYSYYTVSELNFKSDLLFIPAFASYDMPANIAENVLFFPFLHKQYQEGASLVSLCTGSFLLAASGLLNGKSATTHVEASGQFEQAFPEVNLQPHAII